MPFLWNIFKRKRKAQYAMFIDVGTYSVRSLLVETGAFGFIGLKKQTHIFTKRERTEHLAEAIGTRLRELLFRSIKSIRAVPESVVIGLASRITHNTVATTIVSRPEKNRAIAPEELERAAETFRGANRELKRGDDVFVLAEAELVRAVLDGYDFPRARWREGAEGMELGLSFALTYIRKDLFGELEKLKTIAGGIPLHITPAHAAVASFIIAAHPDTDFLLLKIGGAITEVSLIEKGTLLWTDLISFGGEHSTEKIASALAVSPSRAEELKRQYGTLELPERMRERVKNVILGEIGELQKHIRAILIERRCLLPSVMYLYGGGARIPDIETALMNSAWYANLTYRENVSAVRLEADQRAKHLFVNSVLQGPEDMDLAALAAAYQTHLKTVESR